MSKIKTSVIAKIFAWLLIAISGLGLAGSALLMLGLQESGYYDYTLEEVREEQYARYSDRYSARVLEYLGNRESSNQEYFADKNFKYGVIQADSYIQLESLSLNDPENYIERNFEEEITLEDVHVFQCAIADNTYFESDNPESLWGHYWIKNTGGYWHSYEIDKYVYDYSTGAFYCKAEGDYYPIPYILLYLYEEGNSVGQYLAYDYENYGYRTVEDYYHEFDNQEYTSVLEMAVYDADIEAYLKVMYMEPVFNFQMLDTFGVEKGVWAGIFMSNFKDTNDRETYEQNNEVVELQNDRETYELYSANAEIQYETFSDATLEKIVTDQAVRIDPDGYVRITPKGENATNYFVISFQPETLSTYDKHWTQADLYVKFEHVFGGIFQYRYSLFGVFFASLLVYIVSFVFLCVCAGHRKDRTELAESWINKVPLEVYGAVFVLLEVGAIYLLDVIFHYIGNVTDVFWIMMAVLVVLSGGLLLTATGLEFITRMKLGTLFKRTFTYWVCSKLFGICKKIFVYAREHTSMMFRVTLIFIGSLMAEIFSFLVMVDSGFPGLVLLLLVNGVLFIALLFVVVQLQKLKEAGKHVASGELNYKIDTRSMFWDFKEHGENLNSIGDGLSHAVEERMKSERFKTELITNVSHDIKTPLTSIINYVDLIQKEEVNNKKIEEYLEVLERQSKRLKKLLEDLLEASKASAGTLQVGFETLEAGVFMVQTVGEFEEKINTQDLELIIKKPEEPVYINADGRHFWRVIDNLMNNICKYAQPNTRVYINLEANEEEVYITFRNTSRYPLNISSEELMERFVRGDASRTTEGSGLGLSIAQSLMELMHGRFELIVDGDLFKVVLVFGRVNN